MVIGLVWHSLCKHSDYPQWSPLSGLAIVYEAIAFMANSARGVKLVGKNDMLIFAQNARRP